MCEGIWTMIFTGERLHKSDIEGINEFRYKIAAKYCKNKNVLELGCAFGYGSNILLQAGASRLLALDTDAESIKFANSKFKSPKAEFIVTSVEDLKIEGIYDVVACYELIEHLEQPEILLKKINSAIGKNGNIFISTPNRLQSSYDGDQPSNPYHVKEYFPEEFKEILKKYFSNVELYGIRLKSKKMKSEKEVKGNLRWRIASLVVKKRLFRRIMNLLPRGPKRLFTGERNLDFKHTDYLLTKSKISKCDYLLAQCKK